VEPVREHRVFSGINENPHEMRSKKGNVKIR
jgi:hypothetical protein